MHIKGIKIHIVVIALVTGLAAFLGAQWLYQGLNFQKPLVDRLDKEPLVKSYKIDDNADVYQINIALNDNVNLMQAYRQVNDEVKNVMGDRVFKLELTDRRNDQLNKVYNKGKFAIYEALQNGNYVQMAQDLDQYAVQAGVKSNVFIDAENIYWQMQAGKYYLYEVIPRNATTEDLNTASNNGRR